MRWVILVVCVLLYFMLSGSSYSSTFSQAQRVYYTLSAKNGLHGVPRLILNPSGAVNAEYTGWYISINQGMLGFTRNDNELAIVLGHELAHWYLGHSGSNIPVEYAADKEGKYFASRAGFNGCKGISVILRLRSPQTKTHPSSVDRYNRLKCLQLEEL